MVANCRFLLDWCKKIRCCDASNVPCPVDAGRLKTSCLGFITPVAATESGLHQLSGSGTLL